MKFSIKIQTCYTLTRWCSSNARLQPSHMVLIMAWWCGPKKGCVKKRESDVWSNFINHTRMHGTVRAWPWICSAWATWGHVIMRIGLTTTVMKLNFFSAKCAISFGMWTSKMMKWQWKISISILFNKAGDKSKPRLCCKNSLGTWNSFILKCIFPHIQSLMFRDHQNMNMPYMKKKER